MVRTVALLDPGTPVAVRCHPQCPWVPGFVVHGVDRGGAEAAYLVRRPGDQRPLRSPLPVDDVTPEVATGVDHPLSGGPNGV
ncbi:MAG TPA: hypothetical protein VFH45_04820 [Acidimicrobiales bacterium]|nr:hypothetical protein [Acidimicrobiales bacterium]